MPAKREEDIKTLSIGLTAEEFDKLNKLCEYLKKKYTYEVISELIKIIPNIEKIELNNTNAKGQKFIIRTLRFKANDYEAIEKYSRTHFREKNNTVRYFINAGYQIFIGE